MFMNKVKIAITGLSGAGKTAFITSLVHNLLLVREREDFFRTLREFKIIDNIYENRNPKLVNVILENPYSGRFLYQQNLNSLIRGVWPESTKDISTVLLDISLSREPSSSSFFRSKSKSIRLEIVDYPGEWLLDLPLLEMSYKQWSEHWYARYRNTVIPEDNLRFLLNIDSKTPHRSRNVSDEILYSLEKFKDLLGELKDNRRLIYIQPSRFDNIGNPGDRDYRDYRDYLFIPLIGEIKPKTIGSFMNDRFEKYKKEIVKPFVEGFLGSEFHIILVDVINAYFGGYDIFKDTKESITDIMSAYAPKAHNKLYKNIKKMALVATKVDLIPRDPDWNNLIAMLQHIGSAAIGAADTIGITVHFGCISSVRCTERRVEHNNLYLEYNPLDRNGQPLRTDNGEIIVRRLGPTIRIPRQIPGQDTWNAVTIPKMMAIGFDSLHPIRQYNIGTLLEYLMGDLFNA